MLLRKKKRFSSVNENVFRCKLTDLKLAQLNYIHIYTRITVSSVETQTEILKTTLHYSVKQ